QAQKGKQKQSESHGEASSSERPDSTKPSEVKRRKTRNSPDSKWMDNGNSAWLEYRDVYRVVLMFCRCIDRHLAHHEHKAEAEARKSNQSNLVVTFSRQLDANKIKVITQMQCIYFTAKKYIALSIYPNLYQLVDFHKKNSQTMNLCDTPKALQLPSLSSKNLSSESNEY
ncbi:13732_t:CDS:2, partial [Funneliformis mosseae]